MSTAGANPPTATVTSPSAPARAANAKADGLLHAARVSSSPVTFHVYLQREREQRGHPRRPGKQERMRAQLI
eukprot:6182210-Pleurochrysis_carterae.AAC.1